MIWLYGTIVSEDMMMRQLYYDRCRHSMSAVMIYLCLERALEHET